MSILTSNMKVIKIAQKYFLWTFWGFLVTIISDVKIDVNICEPHCVNFFFVNLLHSPGIWFFDIWHLFDNLTSFGILAHYLNHLSSSLARVQSGVKGYVTMWPTPHVPHTPCAPLPMWPIPPVPHTLCTLLPHVPPLPMWPIPTVPHTPVPYYPMCPHCPYPLYPIVLCAPLPMCPIPPVPIAPVPHCPCGSYPLYPIVLCAPLPMWPIPPVSIAPCAPLPMWHAMYPITLCPHCPCGWFPLYPIPPVPYCPMCLHCPCGQYPLYPIPLYPTAHVAYTPCPSLGNGPHG